jgi:undecaprenyl-diphosphatase
MTSNQLLSKIDQWDQSIILKINGWGGKKLTFFLRGLSFFGRETVWICLMIYFLFIWYDPTLFSQISSTFLFGVITIAPIKMMVKRKRPFVCLSQIKILEPKPTSRSFPSWHAYNVFSQGLLFSTLFHSPLLTFTFLTIAFIIAFSRIQLGAHYPSDVIFGCIIGVFGYLISITFLTHLLQFIIGFFENFIIIKVEYQAFSPFLNYFWYIILVFIAYLVVLYIAFYKRIKKYILKMRGKEN